MKRFGRQTMRRAFAAMLILVALGALAPARAFDEETDYIVKCKDSDEPFVVVSEGELRRLDRAGQVEWCEPDGEAVLMGDQPRYNTQVQWNLAMIAADAALDGGYLGQGVRVGVLDSGVNAHPALAGKILPGHNYVDGAEDPDDVTDHFGHGTRVAGFIAGEQEGVYLGVAPGAQIVPLKLTDGNTMKVSTICDAIYDAIDVYDCRILNLSLGVTTEYEALHEAILYAEEKNVLVVASAGNNADSTVYYPAGYDGVIGVGSVNSAGEWTVSNHNASVFLTAPGAMVAVATAQGGYMYSTGTSYAAPQVAGTAAVLLGVRPELTTAELRALLAENAVDAGETGYDEYYGHGVLNVAACIAALTAEPEPEPEPAILCGDADGSGKVNSRDRITLARYFAKWDGYDSGKIDVSAADVNGDGKVNSMDRIILARHIAKWDGYEILPFRKK